jgi:serine/threonine protein kinase
MRNRASPPLPRKISDKTFDYHIGEVVGRGGAALVVQATRQSTTNPDIPPADVVLKLLHEEHEADSDAKERLRIEAWLALALQHDHLVRGLDTFVWQGRRVLVLEHRQGLDLTKVLRRPIPAGVLAGLLLRIAEVLEGMHAFRNVPAGIGAVYHLDLKPDNIRITITGPCVLDLGAAWFEDLSGRMKPSSSRWGTLGITAPEVLDGQPQAKSDVYSLARLLWVVWQQPCHMGPDPAMAQESTKRRHLIETGLTTRLPSRELVVETLCRAMAPDVEERASMVELKDMLDEIHRQDGAPDVLAWCRETAQAWPAHLPATVRLRRPTMVQPMAPRAYATLSALLASAAVAGVGAMVGLVVMVGSIHMAVSHFSVPGEQEESVEVPEASELPEPVTTKPAARPEPSLSPSKTGWRGFGRGRQRSKP